MELLRQRFSPAFIASEFAKTPTSPSPDCCIAPVRCLTSLISTATKMPSSISSTPVRQDHWWFDHHESAFLSPDDAAHFERDQSNRKFYDPDFKSCTSFIAMIAQQRFGFDPAPMADLICWTDIIDAAQYPDAKTAVEMREPAMKLTMVIESAPDQRFVPNLIPLLATKPLAAILEEPFVAPLLPPLLRRHELSKEILKQRTECKDGTIFFDVTDHDLEGYNKFVPYYLHPESIYSVGLSKSSFRVKVSVGSNSGSRGTGG